MQVSTIASHTFDGLPGAGAASFVHVKVQLLSNDVTDNYTWLFEM